MDFDVILTFFQLPLTQLPTWYTMRSEFHIKDIYYLITKLYIRSQFHSKQHRSEWDITG